jgi:ABC-type Fe3+-siderophore transport system permease subunit
MSAFMGAASLPAPISPFEPMVYTNQSETCRKAIGSLICGTLSWVIPPIFAAIPAIVSGHLALSDIKRNAGRLKGQRMALAGLIMGYLGVVLIPFILIIAAIAIPNLLRSRMAANGAAAVDSQPIQGEPEKEGGREGAK